MAAYRARRRFVEAGLVNYPAFHAVDVEKVAALQLNPHSDINRLVANGAGLFLLYECLHGPIIGLLLYLKTNLKVRMFPWDASLLEVLIDPINAFYRARKCHAISRTSQLPI